MREREEGEEAREDETAMRQKRDNKERRKVDVPVKKPLVTSPCSKGAGDNN